MRFSIRALLLVMLGVGGVCSYFVYYVTPARQDGRLASELRAADCKVGTAAVAPPLLRRLIGDAPFQRIVWLRFPTSAQDDQLKLAAQADLLNRLHANGAKFTDNGIQYIARLQHLSHLSLRGTQIVSPKCFANFPLVKLDVADTMVGDEFLLGTTFQETLECIDVSGTRVTDAGVATFERYPQLEVIDLNRTAIGDAAVRRLLRLPTLEELAIRDTKITDAAFPSGGISANLTTLQVVGTDVGDEALASISQYQSITSLDTSRTVITDRGLAHLATLKNLAILMADDTPITSSGLKHLVGLKKLETLFIWNTRCDKEGIRRFRRERPDVRVTSNPAN